MSRRILVAPFLAALLCLIGLPHTASAQCTNSPIRGPAVRLYSTLPCYAVSVTPKGTATPIRPGGTGGYTAAFTVKNTGYRSDTFTFTCVGSAGITCTSFTPTSKTLGSGVSTTVTATYSVALTSGTGNLTLTAAGASGQSGDNGYYSVPIGTYGVAVWPHGGVGHRIYQAGTDQTDFFVVKNTGNMSATFTLSCAATNVVSCGPNQPTTLALSAQGVAGDTALVWVPYHLAYATGTGNLYLTAAETHASDQGWREEEGWVSRVSVTPDGGTQPSRLVGGPYTATFWMKDSVSAGSETYSLACAGTGVVSCSSVSPASSTLFMGDSISVTATYNVSAAGSGALNVTAASPYASDAGSYNVTGVAPTQQPPLVTAGDANSGATIERSLCLTVAMGEAAAAECGDLRVVHVLPTTRTLNRRRTPVLLYNSQLAHPYPLVALNVTLPATAAVPDSVRAVIKVNLVGRDSGAWVGSQWTPGETRRIVLGWDGVGDTTGVYAYTVDVRNWYGATSQAATFAGSVAIVNRSGSAFGAGWWLAGLERLNVSNMVWVGGDGSVRQYQPVVTGSVWAAPNVDHPDTLKKDAVTGNYIRYDKDSVRVTFDPTGQHIATVNRQGHTTSFTWSSGRLATITLPPSGAGKTYQFAYDANNKLHTVSSPGPAGPARTTTVMVTGGQVVSILDPDNTTVQFTYSPSVANALASRTNRRGTVTSYTYDAGERVAQSSIDMGASQPAIVTGFTALETRGFRGTGSVDTTLVYAKLDGPRTDLADSTLFWLTQLGAPRKIVDALGNVTRIDRTDPNWPGLATAITDPTGLQVTAAYDSRANLQTSTQVNPLGDGRNATTSYAWDPKWDEVTKITRPAGDSVNFVYDVPTGNRMWQQDGRGSLSKVAFGYNANNQVVTITRPGTAAEQIGYDASGNPSSNTTPKGYQTTYQNDGVGRPTLITSPFDTAATYHPTQQVYYDAADRDTLTIAVGSAISGPAPAPLESLFVRKHYNANGQVDTLSRYSRPNSTNVGTITTKWRYDPVGRRTAEIAPDGQVDSTAYDAAGNAIAIIPRRGPAFTFTMQYDALNRLTTRLLPPVNYPARSSGIHRITQGLDTNYAAYTIPADTQTFTYDQMNRLLTANNGDAKVKRSYYADGLVKTDSLWIRTLTGANFDQHVYGLTSVYDLDGRRTSLAAPAQLVAGAAATTAYTYDPKWGGLVSATDWQGNVYNVGYNPRGELDSLTYPGQYRELLTLDPDGHAVGDTIQNLGGTASPRLSLSPVRAMRYSYDAGDRLLDGTSSLGFQDTLSLFYSGLGHLVRTSLSQRGQSPVGPTATSIRYWEKETFTYDALALRLHATTQDTLSSPLTIDSSGHGSAYQAGTARLLTDTLTTGVTTYSYNAAGDVEFSQNLGAPAQERASYYAPDGRLRAVAWRTSASVNNSTGTWKKTFDEYRYDALGRRIWMRSQKACLFTNSGPPYIAENLDCATSILRRTVWDGDQEIAEIQMPGDSTAYQENDTATVVLGIVSLGAGTVDPNPLFGRAIYAPGIGLDRPLGVTRAKYVLATDSAGFTAAPQLVAPFTIMPFWTLQGDVPLGVFSTGNQGLCVPMSTGRAGCVSVAWPYYWSAYDRQRFYFRFSWHGSLLEGKQDKSGLQFKRNRYYDPATGQFTQEDPIGLAGGLNAYGFANGDPVNFSDPFGLCPEWVDGKPCDLNAAASLAAGFGDAITFGATNWVREKMGTNDVVDKEGAVYFGGEAAAVAASAALGGATAKAIREGSTFATSGPARSLATKALSSKAAQALFGKGGSLNTGQAFRIGVSRAADGGRYVFRVAGEAVQSLAGTGHINLIDLGRITDFLSAIRP